MLREEQYVLANNGEVRVQPKFLRLTDNLRFSFKAFAKAFGSSFELEVSGAGWDAFQRSIIVRNRITHPKTLTDLTVADSAMKDIFKAIDWYKENGLNLLRSVPESLG